MELIDQHTKKIMEGCKERARSEGLTFEDESLEYIVTNRDMIELGPKHMIPTMYDYWVHDLKVLKEKGSYELYPHNPYETVINTRPPISFYNDNNPDWLNVMIFYHVLGHIDFFQNNIFYSHTWDSDFTEQALADKRLISRLRAEKGRQLDYVLEFARGIDNLVGYYDLMNKKESLYSSDKTSTMTDFYFDVFLQDEVKTNTSDFVAEIGRYNECIRTHDKLGEQIFFSEIYKKYPEFDAVCKKHMFRKKDKPTDVIEFIQKHSPFMNREDNEWMKSVVSVVRNSSMYFQPQIRTKIMNEGWASYWHEKLFFKDDRIKGHEVDFARVNAAVTSIPRVGLNPYALGLRLFDYIEEYVDKGKYSVKYSRILNDQVRRGFDEKNGTGKDFIFSLRKNLNDFSFINTFIDQDFVSRNKLFVVDKRLNKEKMVWEYYVKSRKAEDFRSMVMDSLYHPPSITVDREKTNDNLLYLVHEFENFPLVNEYVAGTLMGLEYLWGGPTKLETHEVVQQKQLQGKGFVLSNSSKYEEVKKDKKVKWRKVLYTMEKRRLSKRIL